MGIKQDVVSNKGNIKGVIFILLFRVSHFFQKQGLILRIIGFPIRLIYKVLIRWMFGIDIPDEVTIGTGLRVYHGMGLVVHTECMIGINVLLRHNTTIGQKHENGKVPSIGDNVDIGAHSIILGDIKIGNNCIIGAGTFIDKDLPNDSIAYGNPLKIKTRNGIL